MLEEQGILPGSTVLRLFHQKSCFSIPQGTLFIKIVCVFIGFVGRHHQRQRAPSQDWKGEWDMIRNTKRSMRNDSAGSGATTEKRKRVAEAFIDYVEGFTLVNPGC